MRESNFFGSLSGVTIALAAVLFFIHSNQKFAPFVDMSITGLIVFFILNIAIFYFARYCSTRSYDKLYMNLIYINLLFKFIITIIIPVIFYFKYGKPSGPFVLPFLIIYITYTVYETWMLNKMAVMRK
jgi:hypothetical protein